MHKLLAMSISTALAISPACARDWPGVGGWSIAESDGSCGMSMEYEGKGETEVLIFTSLDDSRMVLSVVNGDWSATSGQKYELDFLLNGTSYGGGAAIGTSANYKKGFMATFGNAFAKDFAAGTTLTIFRGDVLVDQLSLKGTGAAVAMMRRCLAALQSDKNASEREKRRFAHIADDPFAVQQTDTNVVQLGTEAPIPRSSPGAWVSDADYPSQAQREGRGGTTGYRLEVGADGRATNCIVTSSSGHPDLDEATCRVLPRRARFSSGGVYENKLTWRLPE